MSLKRSLYFCSYYFWRGWVRILGALLFRVEPVNPERVPATGGFMLVANHASYLDPTLVGAPIDRHLHYLAKAELFSIPLFGQVVRSVNAHPIRREGLDRNAMRECIEIMKSGEVLVIFPEGTRSHDGELQAAKGGPAMLAVQAGVKCIPAYVEGTFKAWPRGQSLPRPGKVRVYYGEPFELPSRPDGMSSKEHYGLCADEMMRQIAALRPGATSVS